jgi:ATP-dependent RNA helicase CshB
MFKQYNFKKFINEAIDELGFKKPTAIQTKVIPLVLRGENVIGKSQTGTGKSHAFLFPVLEMLSSSNDLDVLIILPTRELAFQIFEGINQIVKHSKHPIDVRIFVGGTNRGAEISKLEKSQPKIAIGTIGKIKDLAVTTNLLKIHTAKTVVIDEADMVFESSELEEIDSIFSKFQETFQTLVFSATIFNDLTVFLNKYISKFELVDLSEKSISKKSIDHVFIPTKNKNKNELLLTLLTSFHPYLALVFANTKDRVDEVSDFLSSSGLRVGKLTGNLEARERKQMLRRIKDGDYQYVIATDIASRGIDIVGVSHVINYELPNDVEFYIHRTGRTGRAEFDGTAISFYDFDDDVYLNNLERKGLKCIYKALVNGELVNTKERNARAKRIKKDDIIESSVHKKYPLGKVVKPGYKKKRKDIIEKEVRLLKRSRISEIYRKKAREDNNQK